MHTFSLRRLMSYIQCIYSCSHLHSQDIDTFITPKGSPVPLPSRSIPTPYIPCSRRPAMCVLSLFDVFAPRFRVNGIISPGERGANQTRPTVCLKPMPPLIMMEISGPVHRGTPHDPYFLRTLRITASLCSLQPRRAC